jgi:hypothetical protein
MKKIMGEKGTGVICIFINRIFVPEFLSELKIHLKFPLLLLIPSIAFSLSSCEKVINIDLNSVYPQLVVEANLSDKPGPYVVKLSRTVNFSNITDIPMVTGARVEISDSLGKSELLYEVSNGIYKTTFLRGVPGDEYTLTITTGGETYKSVSSMPLPTVNLSLGIRQESDFGHFAGGNQGNPLVHYVINYQIKDPEQYKNYYRFVIYRGGLIISSRRVIDDQFHNGKIIADDINLHDTIDFKHGDTLLVELQDIDKGTYDFFRTFRDGASGMSFLSASPSNPLSNISDNGLGYFNTFASVDRYVVIP